MGMIHVEGIEEVGLKNCFSEYGLCIVGLQSKMSTIPSLLHPRHFTPDLLPSLSTDPPSYINSDSPNLGTRASFAHLLPLHILAVFLSVHLDNILTTRQAFLDSNA